MPKLSVVIITKNEAANVPRALESVAWADDVVVVDSGSSDETVAVARRYTPRVFVRAWHGYGEQKNHAATLADHDWILSLDADERVTPALAAEIQTLLTSEPPARGYRIPRVTWYLGRWIRSTDWYPDYQLRLYDRRVARWTDRHVHESVEIDGEPGRMAHEIEHYAYRDLGHHLDTMSRYTELAARQMREDGKRVGVVAITMHPPLAFLRNYVLRGGFRDGAPGLIVSLMNAFYVFLKLARTWDLQRQAATRPGDAEDRPDRPPAARP